MARTYTHLEPIIHNPSLATLDLIIAAQSTRLIAVPIFSNAYQGWVYDRATETSALVMGALAPWYAEATKREDAYAVAMGYR